MDSGNEVIIVDDSVVTTNGINGNHEEGAEMKTRSKSGGSGGGDEEMAKSKLRNTRAAAEKIVVDEKKKNLRSADVDDAKSSAKDATRKGKTVEDEKVIIAPVVAAVTSSTTTTTTTTTTKKKSGDREDDSGINSRASSVSNDEIVGPRMRTRSKTHELASTSTPTNKRGQSRAPLSSHDFGDSTFDDELPSHSLKRKVRVYIEEMDDIDQEPENGEPVAKRLSIGGSVVSVLWSPLRAIGGKVSAVMPRLKSPPSKVDEIHVENGEDEAEKRIEGNDVEVTVVEAVGDDRTEAKNLSRTCTVMLLTNGVVGEQFNHYDERTTAPSLLQQSSPAVADPPAPLLTSTQSADANSHENANVVKSQMRSLPQDSTEPEIDILINNVVCSFSLGCHLNLRHIALNAHNVEYRRESGVVTMKLRKPQITASLWSSGKITCTGATSADDAKKGARRVARVIQKLGFDAKFRKMRIVNVLGSCSMPFEIKINAFSQQYKEAEYEPELHPGVTYKVKNPKATLKIFSTGSITVTAPSVENVQLAIEHIYPLVFDFRKEFTNREDIQRKRLLTQQRFNQDKLKRKRLNSNNSCSSNDDEDKEVESIMSR